MWAWKLYFLIVVILQIYGMYEVGFSRIWEFIDLPLTLLSFVGLFGFAWKKVIYKQIFWKVFLFILVVWNLFYLFVIPLPAKLVADGSQISQAVTTCILNAPLIVALFFYSFKKDETGKTGDDSKKRIPMGIKLIGFIFGFIFVATLLLQGMVSDVKNMKPDEKIKLMQNKAFEERNITTTEKFDKYFQSKRLEFDYVAQVNVIVVIVLLLGLLSLRNWARVGMILYSVYKIGCGVSIIFKFGFINDYSFKTAIYMTLFICLIFYLTRPKVKEHFLSLKN